MHIATWFSSALTLIALGVGLTSTHRAQDAAPPPGVMILDPAPFGDELRHPIFFAVLEGLYRDGVSTELADKLLEIDPTTKYPANFVWACPICMPVIDALDVYRARPMFRGRKAEADTFGKGLSAEISETILRGAPLARQQTIKSLVENWVRAYLDARRLTPEERAKFQQLMEAGRKQGMSSLEAYRSLGGSYQWMKECPSCEAGNAASRRE